ncbi:PDDEXK nuclease domain-containing protein [Lacinutrix jangbogonensis]|uniref:PDDEXK nuclease domain-containing protein n=1 Tax=Lacinutrix jangbogonensis TaxID=1469557 RepID=UPI00053D2ABC|nr:PDDEXK nuclease domain-containing protein [Lacinutrix jangbogonensis]
MPIEKTEYQNILKDLVSIVEKTKTQVAIQANSALTIMFWQIGKRIQSEILENNRAKYGQEIVVSLSRALTINFGSSFKDKNLRRMIQFSEKFSDFETVVTLSRHLSWSHFLVLIPLKTEKERYFYSKNVFNNLTSVRDLRNQISKKVYERTEHADIQINESKHLEKGVFKDPYLLDFLDLKDGYLENDLESAILKELELFLLELGNGFTFVERQKRMIIDGDDYYLDLLFYHRKLKRLVAIELKIDKFKAKYKGQMELYLKWLEKHEMQEGEHAPIGIILCTEASKEQIELLEMHKDGIMVAEYWTEVLPKEQLEKKLHQALLKAKERIERKKLNE